MTTTSVQNPTNSLPSDILPDHSIQAGASAGPATSLLVALDFHELVAASVNFSPAPKPAGQTPSKSSESADSSLGQPATASYFVPGLSSVAHNAFAVREAIPVQATVKIQTNQPETEGSAFSITAGPTISQFQDSTQSVNNSTAGLSQPTALDGSQSTTRDDTASSAPIAFEAKISSLAPAGDINNKTAPYPNSPIRAVTSQVDRVESVDAAGVKPVSPSACAASEPEDSSFARSGAISYLVTGLSSSAKAFAAREATPVPPTLKIQTNQPEAQGSADSTQAAISTSSNSNCNLNPNGNETLQNPAWPPPSAEARAQLFSWALFAFPLTEGSTVSRFQESTQSVNNLTAGLSQPIAVNGPQSRKNSTTEGSTSSSRAISGQSGYSSVQSLPIELLQPLDAAPMQPIPSDSSLTKSAEPGESPRFSGVERQLADRNNEGSDETQISTTRDDTASWSPIAFEAKISSLAAGGNVNEKTAPYPNSPSGTVTRQADPVEYVDAAEVRPEGLSASASAAMGLFSETPSGNTQRPTATAPEMPITAQLDRLLESERHAQSNQSISVTLTSTQDAPVSVRFVERSGEVHVTVRTADPVLAQDFRSGLSDLSGRLEHAGFRAEVSSQSGTDANLRRDSDQASADSRNSGRQNPQPQRDPNGAFSDRRNPHTSKFAASVNNLIKEQDA